MRRANRAVSRAAMLGSSPHCTRETVGSLEVAAREPPSCGRCSAARQPSPPRRRRRPPRRPSHFPSAARAIPSVPKTTYFNRSAKPAEPSPSSSAPSSPPPPVLDKLFSQVVGNSY